MRKAIAESEVINILLSHSSAFTSIFYSFKVDMFKYFSHSFCYVALNIAFLSSFFGGLLLGDWFYMRSKLEKIVIM